MYYRWPVTAARTGFEVIPFLPQGVQNLMDFTTRRFVFPAFRQPERNKNQPLVGLQSSNFHRPLRQWDKFQRSSDRVCLKRSGPLGSRVFVNKEPLVHRLTSSFYHTISVECLVEETSEAYNATSRTSFCARSVVTWPNTWRLFSFWGGIDDKTVVYWNRLFSIINRCSGTEIICGSDVLTVITLIIIVYIAKIHSLSHIAL